MKHVMQISPLVITNLANALRSDLRPSLDALDEHLSILPRA
jgi:hypothetical protein